jgi:hypothetical protein
MWQHQRIFLMVSAFAGDNTVLLETIDVEFAFSLNQHNRHIHSLKALLDCFQVRSYNLSQQNRRAS